MSRAWKVLGRLAETKVQEQRQELQKINLALTQLEQRKTQIMFLIAENQARLAEKRKGCSMNEIQVITRFITSLGGALQGTQVEMEIVQQKRNLALEKLEEARKEELKMDSLMEREETRRLKERELKEQKAMDAAAIGMFNRK
ncbi:MAG: flagellar export protein FliJ [Burkholderiaceae bacterium]|jgi:flagellar export protein FliJ